MSFFKMHYNQKMLQTQVALKRVQKPQCVWISRGSCGGGVGDQESPIPLPSGSIWTSAGCPIIERLSDIIYRKVESDSTKLKFYISDMA